MEERVLIHRYKLLSCESPTVLSHGVLIEYQGGFAPLHPWEHLGDPPLEKVIHDLKYDRSEPLVKNTLYFCALDGEARRNDTSLFQGIPIVASHHLLRSSIPAALPVGAMVKLKGNPTQGFPLLVEALSRGFTIRLDANASFTLDEFVKFWNGIPPAARKKIAFVEDPTPWSPTSWRKLHDLGVPLAIDWVSPPNDFIDYDTYIIKPARDDFVKRSSEAIKHGKSVVITSYLAHPLDQIIACWVASRLAVTYPDKVLTAGYLSHGVYEPNEFIIQDDGHRLLVPHGSGFGFDEQLRGLSWEPL